MIRKVIVTGAAGFIGFHIIKRLLKENFAVLGIDNINNYYDVRLKNDRLININNSIFRKGSNWKFFKSDLEDDLQIQKIFSDFNPEIVINLAAQAGVRNSILNPQAYIKSNLVGFGNILEACRKNKVKNLIYASSSSVYGDNSNIPFKENAITNNPVSLYAATKSANELMANSYAHLYKIPTIGLRFFTVYGPWGRPDMAPMIFADSILRKKSINVFNNGNMRRDFTYIDDVVEGIFRCCLKPPTLENCRKELYLKKINEKDFTSHKIYNIGNSAPINLLEFISILENEFGIKAIKDFKPMQLGDVVETYANTDAIENWINFKPNTSLVKGIHKFAEWYKKYY